MAISQTTCIKCGSSLDSRLFCFSCNIIQPLTNEANFFELLQCNPSNELASQECIFSDDLHPQYNVIMLVAIVIQRGMSILDVSLPSKM